MADVNFFSPTTPIDPKKALKYAQQQALAKAMMDEGNTPTDTSKYQIGGVAYAMSPLEGLAKALKSGLGAYKGSELEKDYSTDVGNYQTSLAKALKSGSLEGMIAASADDPSLSEFGKDLALSKAKSDYEVNKLMAIEQMKIQMDPEKRFINGVLGGGGQPAPEAAPLPPTLQPSSDTVPAPSPQVPLPAGAAMGSAVDTNNVQSAFVLPDIQQGVSSSPAGKGLAPPPAQNDVQSAMLSKYLGQPREGLMWSMGPNGQPTQVPNPNAKLTDDQTKAGGFYERMQEADPVFTSQATEGMKPENVTIGSIPLIGNMGVSSGYQQFNQAKRNFVNAILRRESGAAISPSEFENANQQYFPQPGDNPEVLKQKAQNRQTAMGSMRTSAGPSYQAKNQQPDVDPEEGKTATNPQTGHKIVKRGGQWVPL